MKSYLRIALRNLYRDKVYAAINIAGLAMAICCCLIVGLYLRNELTYDQHHLNHKKIYRVATEYTTNGTANQLAVSSRAMGPILKDSYPEIEDYVRFILIANRNKVTLRHSDVTYSWENVYVATDNVFKVFTHKILYGDPKTALVDPASIAVSETFARKYFGNENPIGKTLVSDTGISRQVKLVFADLPDNSHLKYDLLYSANQDMFRLPNDINTKRLFLWAPDSYTYLVLPAHFNVASYNAMSQEFYQKNMEANGRMASSTWRSWLQPLADIHLYSNVQYDLPMGNRFYLFGFAAVGIFILAVACINYINLATAKAIRRAKSIGVRKILGATRSRLIFQFLSEALFFSLIAVILGIVITEIALTLSPLNSLIGKQLSLNLLQEPLLLILILAGGLLIGFVSGLYPAFYLSSWAPISTMVGRNVQGKNSVRFRQTLVFLQFTISIAVIASTLLMSSQMNFIANKSLGFAKENRVMITLRGIGLIEKAPALMKDLSTHKGILGATTSDTMMGQIVPIGIAQVDSNAGVMERTQIAHTSIGENFLEVMGMKLVSGRDFSKKMLTDAGANFIVNESFVRKMGWTEPIGKRIQVDQFSGKVIGVVTDFNFKSLHTAVEPFALHPMQNDFSNLNEIQKKVVQRLLILNIAGENIRDTLRFLQDKFAEVDPSHPFEFKFVDDSLNELYRSEQSMMKLIGIFAVICILISCMGLFGLAVFTTEQRTKEIGIRKVLGASTSQIIALLSRNILALVVAGAVVASIIAYLAIDKWLAGFAYRASINPLIFFIATCVAVFVAYLTIALQSYRTATANPVEALRYE